MSRPRLLDLFCGEGGAAVGYARAGFEVVGVDKSPMPRYPFEVYRKSVSDLTPDHLRAFDAVHASPPCKVHTSMRAFSSSHHTDMIPETRALLTAAGRPWIIENVVGAPLVRPVCLCGSMFGLHVRRHRLFEASFRLVAPRCQHRRQEAESPGFKIKKYHSGSPVVYTSPVVGVFGRGQGYGEGETELWRSVMEMPWASKDGLREAVPPAYTEYLGWQLMRAVHWSAAA